MTPRPRWLWHDSPWNGGNWRKPGTISAAAGIRFRHTSGASGRLYRPETLGSGCGVLDYDGDGRLDLFLVNSTRLPGYSGKGPFYPALYRNRGDGAFEDVTAKAGLQVDG